ncbi:MAG: sugar kinase, partial [Stackebrandtia sp.]
MNFAAVPPQTYDVITVGESMVLVASDPPAPLLDGRNLRLSTAGAESNVAAYVALLGSRSAWRGRIGADPFGELIRKQLRGVGVDVSMIEVDKSAPTGVYFKEPRGNGVAVYYYRHASAASTMSRSVLDNFPVTRAVHLTGVTAALSDACMDMMVHALMERPLADVLMSFDVNYRPSLWPPETARSVLSALAGAADLVFVGRDEAQMLWGARSADDVRVFLPGPATLVVKDANVGATVYEGTSDGVFVPAPKVDVVDPVGAGDAFAAGYLHGLLKG